MSSEEISGKVLFVDDDEIMRKMLVRQARFAGIEDFEVFEDAQSAVTGLNELDETVTAIFSDGLNGGWRNVVAAAREARVPAVVLSGDESIQQAVEDAGAIFLNKVNVTHDFIETTIAELRKNTER